MLSYKSGVSSISCCRDDCLKNVVFDKKYTFAKNTTYGLGGSVKGAFFPRTLNETRAVYDYLNEEGEAFTVIANGSNILASDSGYEGYVICTKMLRGIIRIDANTIFCLSGTPVGTILKYCAQRGLGGLEYLTGIPASIGGITCMNGGAGGVYINSNVISVKLYNGKNYNLSNKNCNFTYKHSTMRDINDVILGVFLQIKEDNPQIVRERISHFAAGRRHLPKGKSCGCVFKNVIARDGAMRSAGAIIEACGLGGFGDENAYVSPLHCNFIINKNASARRIYDLIGEVKSKVLNDAGISLEEEVVYIGKF